MLNPEELKVRAARRRRALLNSEAKEKRTSMLNPDVRRGRTGSIAVMMMKNMEVMNLNLRKNEAEELVSEERKGRRGVDEDKRRRWFVRERRTAGWGIEREKQRDREWAGNLAREQLDLYFYALILTSPRECFSTAEKIQFISL